MSLLDTTPVSRPMPVKGPTVRALDDFVEMLLRAAMIDHAHQSICFCIIDLTAANHSCTGELTCSYAEGMFIGLMHESKLLLLISIFFLTHRYYDQK
jgi:hypothetical protein